MGSRRDFAVAGSGALLALAALRADTGHPAAMQDHESASLLFVQSATQGSLVRHGDVMLLSLEGHAGQTVYFSDRPDRVAGLLRTSALVDDWPFAEGDPPNAALAIDGGDVTIVVGVLRNPEWDDNAGTLTYAFTPIPSPDGTPFDGVEVGRATSSFSTATLFIDSSMVISNFSNRSQRISIWKKPPA
ncbi:MAG: hypothetical protein ACTHMX_00620 [Thermomicrobiales bacterium]|jgi:hypothetical protein